MLKFHQLRSGNAMLLKDADVFDNPIDTAQLTAFIADRGHRMVFVTSGDRVIGMASGSVLLHPDKQPSFFINEIAVVKDMRRRGIGTRLVQMLMKDAREAGCQNVWLATEADNVEARALYSKLDGRASEAVVVYDWDELLFR